MKKRCALFLLPVLFWLGCVPCTDNQQKLNDELYRAFEKNDKAAMQRSIDRGADVNYGGPDGLDIPMLWSAVMLNDEEMVGFLLANGANAKDKDENGRTLLSYANNAAVGKMLLDGGCVPSDADDMVGNNALHWSCGRHRVDSDYIVFLLNNGTTVSDKNRRKWTPLHIACLCDRHDNKLEIIKILLEHGAAVNAEDDGGTTPIQWASMRENPETIKLLLRKGAEIDHQDQDGNTALHYAHGLKGQKNIPVLLENGADPSIRNKAGQLYHELKFPMPPDP